MLVGCYTLDLYCDNADCTDTRDGPWQYCAETGATCRREARDAGWIITDEKQICPKCSGKKRKPRKLSRNSLAIYKKIDAAMKDGAEFLTISELKEKMNNK